MLLIIWHSRTGAARALAQAAYAAAGKPCRLINAAKVTAPIMASASAYLFVCPENLGSMTGEMKAFFDRCYYPLLGEIEGRPYATLIAAGSDGAGAQAQIDRIVIGWRLRRVAPAVIVNVKAQTPAEIMAEKVVSADHITAAQELGALMGQGLQLGII